PERGCVGLEDDELHALVNRLAQEKQCTAYVDILQIGVGIPAERARAPDTNVTVERADTVDALRVQSVLQRFAYAVLQTERPQHWLISRGFVHAPLRVDAGVDASNVPARRHKPQPVTRRVLNLGGRIEDLEPREVESDKVGIARQQGGSIIRLEQCCVES